LFKFNKNNYRIDYDDFSNFNKFTVVDESGYKYIATWFSENRVSISHKFDKNNVYSVYNLKILLNQNFPNFVLLSTEYVDTHSNITLQDSEGYFYSTSTNHLRNGRIPDRFNNSNKYVFDNINLWLKKTDKKFHLISDNYKNKLSKLYFNCRDCNRIFSGTWNNVYYGDKGCSFCNQSKGEKRTENFLNFYNIEYIKEHQFKECKNKNSLRFDFYLCSLNICIEYDGEQHFQEVDFSGRGEDWSKNQLEITRKNDMIKNNFCKKNKIKLIRIPYFDYDNIEKILLDELGVKSIGF